MTFGNLPLCPFIAGPMITDPRLFVGRKRILSRLAVMVQQPVSANVVGERRMGKSSLLYNFYQTWEQRVHAPDKYCVVYLNLQDAQCDREALFYRAVLRSLQQKQPPHSALAQLPVDADRLEFAESVRQYKRLQVLPVLCLDEFEALFENTQEFNDGFFDNLRTLMNSSDIMLVLASRKSLDVYKKKHRLTSDFFNLGQIIRLGDLEAEEVDDLVRLPASNVSDLPAALGVLEQEKAKAWGEQHPCKLQYAASFLWQAGQQGYGEKWARQLFLIESERLPKRRPKPSLISAVGNLGKLAQGIGSQLDDFGNLVTGSIILVVALLAICGVLGWEEVKLLINEILGG
jgi:uncharacterized protein